MIDWKMHRLYKAMTTVLCVFFLLGNIESFWEHATVALIITT